MSGGNESSDPWGIREEPEDIQGLGNMEIRQQQQHILRGKWTGPKVTKLCSCSTQLSMKFGLNYMSRDMKKQTFWFPTRSDTNQAVKLQKMARGLEA